MPHHRSIIAAAKRALLQGADLETVAERYVMSVDYARRLDADLVAAGEKAQPAKLRNSGVEIPKGPRFLLRRFAEAVPLIRRGESCEVVSQLTGIDADDFVRLRDLIRAMDSQARHRVANSREAIAAEHRRAMRATVNGGPSLLTERERREIRERVRGGISGKRWHGVAARVAS